MSNDKKRNDFLDSYWDISDLIPSGKSIRRKPKSIDLSEVDTNDRSSTDKANNETRLSYTSFEGKESPTLIKREININSNHYAEHNKIEQVFSYTPTSSLIHEVVLKKKSYPLNFYDEFEGDAKRYYNIEESDAEYEPYFSYVPQYNQLNEKQKKYYFFWRTNVRRGIFENTDYSYILLYCFELINLDDESNIYDRQMMLTELWNAYHKTYPMISAKLIGWIIDFGLVHKLPPPANLKKEMVSETRALKEYFISVPDNNFDLCAETLLKYCSSYDYHTSKFSKGDNIKIYDAHVKGALCCAVRYYSENGKILSKLSNEDSRMEREAFSGALCTNRNRYIIEIKYCSFSCSNELRFLVGDIVKYAENKIRAGLGIKSRLSTYSVNNELKEEIDAYFEKNLIKIHQISNKKEERQEYEVLYDVPIKPLSLSDAMKIEESSWDTTNDLIAAFEDSNCEVYNDTVRIQNEDLNLSKACPETFDDIEEGTELKKALGTLHEVALAIRNNDRDRLCELTKEKMIDAVVDEINEISAEVIGDILIEQDEHGTYVLIECYCDMI